MLALLAAIYLLISSALGVPRSKTVHPDWKPYMDKVMSTYSRVTIQNDYLPVEEYLRKQFLPPVISSAVGISGAITIIDMNCGLDANILGDRGNIAVIHGFNYTRCPSGRRLSLLCLPDHRDDLNLTRRQQLEIFFFATTEILLNADYYTTIAHSFNNDQRETRHNKLSFDAPRAKNPMNCNIKQQSLVIVGRPDNVGLLPKVSSLLCRFISVLMVTVEQSPVTLIFNNRTGCVSEKLSSRDLGYGFLLAPNCRQLEGDEIDPRAFVWYDEKQEHFGPHGVYSTKLFDYSWNVAEQHHRALFLYFNKFNKTEPPLLFSIEFKTMLSTSYLENRQALIGAVSATRMSAVAITPPADPSRHLISEMFLSPMASITLMLAIVIGIIFSVQRARSVRKAFYYTFYLIFTVYVPIQTNLLTHKRVMLFSTLILTGWFQGTNIISVSIKSEVTASMHSLSEYRLRSVNSCQELSEYLPFAEFLELETPMGEGGGINSKNSTWLIGHWKKYTRSTIKEIGYTLDRWCLAGLTMYLGKAVCAGDWRLQHIVRKLDPFFDIHIVSTPNKPELRHIVFNNLKVIIMNPPPGLSRSSAISVNYVDKAHKLAFETLRGGLYHKERMRTGYYVIDGGNITTILIPKQAQKHGRLGQFLGPFMILGGGCAISAISIVIELFVRLFGFEQRRVEDFRNRHNDMGSKSMLSRRRQMWTGQQLAEQSVKKRFGPAPPQVQLRDVMFSIRKEDAPHFRERLWDGRQCLGFRYPQWTAREHGQLWHVHSRNYRDTLAGVTTTIETKEAI